ncbi:MAG: hypothetical protein R3C19_01715 [Planctomycetaceae bacterium]
MKRRGVFHVSSTASGSRSGLTLLEVIIATAVFLGALSAIMQIFRLGADAEIMTQMDSEAVMRAESLMAELVIGVQPLQSVSGQAFEDGAPRWRYDVQVDSEIEGLLRVSVTVNHVQDGGRVNSTYTLIRLVRDPQVFLDAAMSAGGDE